MKKLSERFWNLTKNSNNGCKLWVGGNSNRHARFHLLKDEQELFGGRKDVSAHLVSWWLTHGTHEKFVDRTCDDTLCVEPEHLIIRTEESRFWSRVDKLTTPDGCWPWLGGKHTFGYGSTSNGSAHRVAYQFAKGQIPNGEVVRHTCHNPTCCRPAHLITGTQKENVHDAIKAGRMNYAGGERIHQAKLSNVQADAIHEIFDLLRTVNPEMLQNVALEKLALAVNVNVRTIWRVVKGRSYKSPNKKSSVDRNAYSDTEVTQIIQDLRVNGFPWTAILNHEENPIERVRAAKVTIIDNVIKGIGYSGQQTCLDVHRHRYSAKHRTQLSIIEAFNDDKILARAVRYQLKCGDPTTPAGVIRALQAIVRAPRNFPPALARWIVDEYVPLNGIVLDPCSGYGGRLLGALSSSRNAGYVGFDIENKSVEGNILLANNLQQTHRVIQKQQAVEDFSIPWPTADLVLTSPPYFDTEQYSEKPITDEYSSYELWHDGFLRTLVKRALDAAPTVILNVANVGDHDLPRDVILISKELDATVERILTWPLKKFGKRGSEEKIIVMRRK